jgi:formyl-CoA transferase
MRDQAGFGAIGEAMGGLRYVTGHPDRPPVRSNLSIGDALASLHGVIGVLMALEHRRTSGRGQVVDVALYEAVFNMMESTVPEFDLYGIVRERTGSYLTGIVPSNSYPTRDGQHILIAGNGDSIFKRLMQAIGRADLAADPSLADNAGRAKRVEELDEAIGAWTVKHEADTVVAKMNAAQVPVGKVFSAAEMLTDPQYLAREMIASVTLPDGATMRVPGTVPKLSATPGGIEWPGPALGAHTEEVLRAHGYTADAIRALREKSAI